MRKWSSSMWTMSSPFISRSQLSITASLTGALLPTVERVTTECKKGASALMLAPSSLASFMTAFGDSASPAASRDSKYRQHTCLLRPFEKNTFLNFSPGFAGSSGGSPASRRRSSTSSWPTKTKPFWRSSRSTFGRRNCCFDKTVNAWLPSAASAVTRFSLASDLGRAWRSTASTIRWKMVRARTSMAWLLATIMAMSPRMLLPLGTASRRVITSAILRSRISTEASPTHASRYHATWWQGSFS
mmetsp:Transcript_9399/g.38488  ORF Transcript_9399/g.38488 Transcript_9399/m.38488 type:complete len:244 (+) Transcript_9399:437-1168(+)